MLCAIDKDIARGYILRGMDIKTYALNHGGFPQLAETLGFNAEFLRQVAKGRRRFSPANAILVESKTNGAVRREELRPDIFGPLDTESIRESVQKLRQLPITPSSPPIRPIDEESHDE